MALVFNLIVDSTHSQSNWYLPFQVPTVTNDLDLICKNYRKDQITGPLEKYDLDQDQITEK